MHVIRHDNVFFQYQRSKPFRQINYFLFCCHSRRSQRAVKFFRPKNILSVCCTNGDKVRRSFGIIMIRKAYLFTFFKIVFQLISPLTAAVNNKQSRLYLKQSVRLNCVWGAAFGDAPMRAVMPAPTVSSELSVVRFLRPAGVNHLSASDFFAEQSRRNEAV